MSGIVGAAKGEALNAGATISPPKRVLNALPRPSKMGISEEQRAQLLMRESDECGPTQLASRFKAVAQAAATGDPRFLAGTLEDLASAALNWQARTLLDGQRKPPAKKKSAKKRAA